MPDPQWRTLPLFDRTAVQPHELPPLRRVGSPMDLVLHIYWSAGIGAHALGALAARSPYPDQRRALRELQGLEEQRKELAARLLRAIWRVELPASPAERLRPASPAASEMRAA